MARLRVEFGEVWSGWLPLRIELEGQVWEGAASFVQPLERPSLDGLCDSLCDVVRRQSTRAVEFFLEPSVLELRFADVESRPHDLRVDLFERNDDHSRAPAEPVFGAVLPRDFVVRTFWRSLRRLKADVDPEEFAKYFAPFPSAALARLTALVQGENG